MTWDSIKSAPGRMLTYQDFERAGTENTDAFVYEAIRRHISSVPVQTALIADMYDAQRNKTIMDYVNVVRDVMGRPCSDFISFDTRIASNFFHRLNTQRVMYSLGAGVGFIDSSESAEGTDETKQRLGKYFDHDLQSLAYKALIHGVAFGMWNYDRLYCFPLTEFVPLWDEMTGTLRAGIRFWRLDPTRPMQVVLYEEDGYTRFESVTSSNGSASERLVRTCEKRAYKERVRVVPFEGESEVISSENYSSLPIVALWGSRLHQSTLVGMRESIDSYDLIRSGFANDLQECAEVYWLVSNAGGMSDTDLQQFLDRLKINHVALVDSDDGGQAQGYTHEIPYAARKEYLDMIRAGIYEDFGALDVHTVEAGATNDHIDAAYQPMDEEASDFEFQVGEFVMQILALMGIDDTPVFKRQRISNQLEQVQMVAAEAEWLDTETILRKLPNIRADEVASILDRKQAEVDDMTIVSAAEERAGMTDLAGSNG